MGCVQDRRVATSRQEEPNPPVPKSSLSLLMFSSRLPLLLPPPRENEQGVFPLTNDHVDAIICQMCPWDIFLT